MSRAKYAHVVVVLQYALVKSYSVSKTPYRTKNLRLTVPVFLFLLERTALLLKTIHLHLHSDRLMRLMTMSDALLDTALSSLSLSLFLPVSFSLSFTFSLSLTLSLSKSPENQESVHIVATP